MPIRAQIDPRKGLGQSHNRISGFYDQPYGFHPEMQQQAPQQQPAPQQQAPQQQSSTPDLNSLLSAVSGATGGFGGPNFQLPGISSLSAGGGMQVGPNGISFQNADQSSVYDSYMDTVSALGTGQQGLVGNIIANMLGLAGTTVNADAQRDVAGIQGQTAENVAMTNAQSEVDVANIAANSAAEVQRLQNAGLITQQEADQKLAETNNAANQRIAEIQAQASVRPAELQYQQFERGLETIPMFMAMLAGGGGGGIPGAIGDAFQLDPQALVNNAQAQNAQQIAAQNRAGAAGGGAAANDAAARDAAQQLASANARAAYEIPMQVGQQNFNNQQQALNTRNNVLGNLMSLITG